MGFTRLKSAGCWDRLQADQTAVIDVRGITSRLNAWGDDVYYDHFICKSFFLNYRVECVNLFHNEMCFCVYKLGY